MIAFQISAPGRIILCGEHTVMYGKQVVAASLDLRTTLKFVELPAGSTNIHIEFPDVDVSLDIPLQMIFDFMATENYDAIADDYIIFLKHVQYFITLNGLWISYPQRFSLQTFFFLLLFVAQQEVFVIKPFNVRLITQLPINAGLGSSTSFATCLAACFLHWSRLQKGDHREFTLQELERISEYVMYSEEVIQNYVLKPDHSVCTFGHVVTLQCKEPLIDLHEFISAPEMNIMLIDSKIQLDKNQQMKQLAAMRYTYGNAVDVLLDRINIVSQVIASIFRIIKDYHRTLDLQLLDEFYEILQTNLSLNQELLRNLDLSHSNFDTICSIAKTYGFKGKVTGVGGSFVIILLPLNISKHQSNRIYNLTAHLMRQGFIAKTIKISCNGVQIDQMD